MTEQTDLERAREHLRRCQMHLENWRKMKAVHPRPINIGLFYEDNVLAALRWVAYEQEKEAFAQELECDPTLYEAQWPAR